MFGLGFWFWVQVFSVGYDWGLKFGVQGFACFLAWGFAMCCYRYSTEVATRKSPGPIEPVYYGISWYIIVYSSIL